MCLFLVCVGRSLLCWQSSCNVDKAYDFMTADALPYFGDRDGCVWFLLSCFCWIFVGYSSRGNRGWRRSDWFAVMDFWCLCAYAFLFFFYFSSRFVSAIGGGDNVAMTTSWAARNRCGLSAFTRPFLPSFATANLLWQEIHRKSILKKKISNLKFWSFWSLPVSKIQTLYRRSSSMIQLHQSLWTIAMNFIAWSYNPEAVQSIRAISKRRLKNQFTQSFRKHKASQKIQYQCSPTNSNKLKQYEEKTSSLT